MEASIRSIQERRGGSAAIHPDTVIGAVHLNVMDLDRQIRFYQTALGFRLHWREGGSAGLGAGREDILLLTETQQARRRLAAGLYHAAFLMPSRQELARSLRRLAATRTPLQGAADHWFSEAIYLADPEGNGIEIYRDRPRPEWPPMEEVVQRGNGYFDLNRLLAEAEEDPQPERGLHPDARLGHIHLRVGNTATAEAFYSGGLGFEKMMEFGDQAGFVSAGGYHHHIAYNVWAGRGIPSAQPTDAGLREFSILLPSQAALEAVSERVRQSGAKIDEAETEVRVRDPFGITIVLAQATNGTNRR